MKMIGTFQLFDEDQMSWRQTDEVGERKRIGEDRALRIKSHAADSPRERTYSDETKEYPHSPEDTATLDASYQWEKEMVGRCRS